MSLKLAQYQSLLDLSRSPNLYSGSHVEFIKECIFMLSRELDVPRVSFWLYDPALEIIINQMMYNRTTEEYSSGEVLEKEDYPNYFTAFQSQLLINAEDAINDPRTKEFSGSYLNPNGIKSMLDIQVSVRGNLFGIICLEQTNQKRHWSEIDELFTSSVAAYIGQSYLSQQSNEAEKKRKTGEISYRKLFMDSPIPAWVYDRRTLKFLAVSQTAIDEYGYTEEEFLQMRITDIYPDDEQIYVLATLNDFNQQLEKSRRTRHIYKSGEIIEVEVASDWTLFHDRKARMVIATNVTKETKLVREKEAYIEQLRDFAFYASHDLRGPVSRLLGLNTVLEYEREKGDDTTTTLDHIHDTINEIDRMIITLNSKLEI